LSSQMRVVQNKHLQTADESLQRFGIVSRLVVHLRGNLESEGTSRFQHKCHPFIPEYVVGILNNEQTHKHGMEPIVPYTLSQDPLYLYLITICGLIRNTILYASVG
jgi:hypothetical protein